MIYQMVLFSMTRSVIKVTEYLYSKCIYIVLIFVHARRSGMDHTVLPAITPMPAFTL